MCHTMFYPLVQPDVERGRNRRIIQGFHRSSLSPGFTDLGPAPPSHRARSHPAVTVGVIHRPHLGYQGHTVVPPDLPGCREQYNEQRPAWVTGYYGQVPTTEPQRIAHYPSHSGVPRFSHTSIRRLNATTPVKYPPSHGYWSHDWPGSDHVHGTPSLFCIVKYPCAGLTSLRLGGPTSTQRFTAYRLGTKKSWN